MKLQKGGANRSALFDCGLLALDTTSEDINILTVARLELTLRQRPWLFAEQNRQQIDRHWALVNAASPSSWNGSVLMAYDVNLSGETFTASFLKSDYASFIAWRDWGWPDRNVYNCFGSAIIKSNDGAIVYGCMAGHTLNAGLCYPPGGSLDMSDLRDDGSIDMNGSISRELAEETGLDAHNAVPSGLWAVFDEHRISIARQLTFDSTAEQLAQTIRAHIASEGEPELSDAVVLRSLDDLTHPMPGYARHLARQLLAD